MQTSNFCYFQLIKRNEESRVELSGPLTLNATLKQDLTPRSDENYHYSISKDQSNETIVQEGNVEEAKENEEVQANDEQQEVNNLDE